MSEWICQSGMQADETFALLKVLSKTNAILTYEYLLLNVYCDQKSHPIFVGIKPVDYYQRED